jgi:hypothetical protein
MSYLQTQRNRGRKGGEFAYVHLARSVWDPSRGRSVQKRVYVGRLDPSGKHLVLSKGYGVRSGERVELAELRRRVAAGEDIEAWLRVPSGGTGDGAAPQDAPAGVAIVGDAHVLLALARETGLARLLEDAFGAEEGQALLGVALHQAAEGRAVYLAADWLEEREVPAAMHGELLQTDRVYGLIAAAGADTGRQERFFRGWIGVSGKPEALIYDITSISTYARDLELAEYGYNRDGESLPQINLALVSDAHRGRPLWYRPLPGSIPDVSTLKLTGELLNELGLERFSYSLDRGFYSQANVRDMLAEGIGFTLGVPFSVGQARALVRRHRTALASAKRSFPFHDRVIRHVRDTWRAKGARGRPRELDAHLFFEPARQAESMTRVESAVFALEAKAARESFLSRHEAWQWLDENAGSLRSCLAVRPADKGGFRIERKARAVALATSRLGFTLVLTSERECPREEVLARYRGRDRVEKLIDALKNEDGQYRLRTGNDHAAAGKLLVAFLALILHGELERRMRDAGLLRRMSVTQFLAQMRKVKSVRMASGSRHLLEITKRNRDLMAAVSVPLPD